MEVIETLAKVVLGWTTLALAMGVVWARFMGHLKRMDAAVAAQSPAEAFLRRAA